MRQWIKETRPRRRSEKKINRSRMWMSHAVIMCERACVHILVVLYYVWTSMQTRMPYAGLKAFPNNKSRHRKDGNVSFRLFGRK